MQSAAFGCDHPDPVLRFSVAKRPESVRIPDRYQFCGRHEHKRVCSLDLIHRKFDRFYYRCCLQSGAGDHVGDRFGVAGAVEDRTGQFETVA